MKKQGRRNCFGSPAFACPSRRLCRLWPGFTRALVSRLLLFIRRLPLRGFLTALGLAGVSGRNLRQPDTILGPAVRQVRVTDRADGSGRFLNGASLARTFLCGLWLGG
jgi:hypothetical protein